MRMTTHVGVWCLVCLAGMFLLVAGAGAQEAKGPGAPNAEKLGWHLGCQAYSFNRFTFFEAIDKVNALGLKWIEAYPGQALSPEKRDVKFSHDASPLALEEVKLKLHSAGVTLINYGVVNLPNNEAECRKVFDFAKKMGIETIVSEPSDASKEAFDLIDRLCQEYDINVAIHNHPGSPKRPNYRYWDPKYVLQLCEGRSKHIGSCADTGHWMRSGVNPVEALKLLEGRVVSFHFKDLNKFGPSAHDVPWGTGEGDVDGMLAEVYRQGFKGVFSVEYEHNWENSVPEIAQGVAYFDQVAAKLAK